MYPTLKSGDVVCSVKAFKLLIKVNSIVIFFDKYYSFIIKKVLSNNDGTLILKSDNSNIDSYFCKKPINVNKIKYVVIFKIRGHYLRKIGSNILA